MLMSRIRRWELSTWILLPVIAGLLCTTVTLPVTPAYAATFPIQTPEDARTWGLDSLGNMMRSEAAIGQPLVLSPEFKVPLPANLASLVKDRQAALRLGKALFWEMQVGSDGIQACASCHFQAGADIRTKNQVATQGGRVLEQRQGDIKGYFFAPPDPDTTFEAAFLLQWAPNYQLSGADFPTVLKQNTYLRNGNSILSDQAVGNRNDVVGSMGVMPATFAGVNPGSPVDNYLAGTLGTLRPTTGRNAPGSVNAVFNLLQFWDGRADTLFNGVNPIGRHDISGPKYFVNVNGTLEQRTLDMSLASLASQGTGPPLSAVEMSFADRTWPDIGQKLLRAGTNGPIKPLAYQNVHPADSVLGPIANPSGPGLTINNYADMVKAAFNDELWNLDSEGVSFPMGKKISDMDFVQGPAMFAPVGQTSLEQNAATGVYTQMESNFSLFWGIAVMLYQAELVSPQSKFDKWMEGTATLTPAELDGLNVFVNQGKCIACHSGPEFTNATVRNTQNGQEQIEPVIRRDGTPAFYDNGFYNVGMEPTVDDLQRGAQDPNGFPWGNARQFLFQKNGIQNIPFSILGLPIQGLTIRNQSAGYQELWKVDPAELVRDIFVCVDTNLNGVCDLEDDIKIKAIDQDGSCKTPTLRNISLSGPYFHNGGAATLQQAVTNYDLGGKFSRTPMNKVDMLPDMSTLRLDQVQTPNGTPAEEALVAFMLTLTDDRVRKEQAPFDHPQFYVPIDGTAPVLDPADPAAFFIAQIAAGKFKELPATGGDTGGPDLLTFLNLDPFADNTGKGNIIENQFQYDLGSLYMLLLAK